MSAFEIEPEVQNLSEGQVYDEKYIPSLSACGVKDQRVAFFFKLCRGLSRPRLDQFIDDVLAQAPNGDGGKKAQCAVDLFVIAVQSRDIKSGKGERMVFYWAVLKLHSLFPETTQRLLWLIPTKYGSWKDILLLLEMYLSDHRLARTGENMYVDDVRRYDVQTKRRRERSGEDEDMEVEDTEKEPCALYTRKQAFKDELNRGELGAFGNLLVDMFKSQLEADEAAATRRQALLAQKAAAKDALELELLGAELNKKENRMSLCAKWAPREGKAYSALAKLLAVRMDATRIAAAGTEEGPLDAARKGAYAAYRRRVAALNKAIQTTEVVMSDATDGGRWATLKPGSIPARCLKRNRDAFFNEKLGHGDRQRQKVQRSSKPDRIKCAEVFKKYMEDAIEDAGKEGGKTVHGAALMPHEMVREVMKSNFQEDLTIEAQWIDLRERLRAEGGGLKNFIPLCDVSGSMAGIPMEVSVAMGILISELNNPAFANQFITFDESPTWHKLNPSDSFREKVRSSLRANWGNSTDFYKAMMLVLDTCKANSMPVEDLLQLKLIVFSDMQFDCSFMSYRSGYTPFSTKYEQIKQMFKTQGYVDPATGAAAVPRMIFWNLRGDTMDFPADAEQPGVDMVSGFSQQGLKVFMDEGDLSAAPYEGLRKILDDERYDSVRAVCAGSSEFTFCGTQYTILPPHVTK